MEKVITLLSTRGELNELKRWALRAPVVSLDTETKDDRVIMLQLGDLQQQ